MACAGGDKTRAGIAVWDTGQPAPAVLPIAKNDWTPIALGQTVDAFKGDTVVSNGRIVMFVRQKDEAVEVHAVNNDGAVSRVRLRLQTSTGEPAVSGCMKRPVRPAQRMEMPRSSKTSISGGDAVRTERKRTAMSLYRKPF